MLICLWPFVGMGPDPHPLVPQPVLEEGLLLGGPLLPFPTGGRGGAGAILTEEGS